MARRSIIHSLPCLQPPATKQQFVIQNNTSTTSGNNNDKRNTNTTTTPTTTISSRCHNKVNFLPNNNNNTIINNNNNTNNNKSKRNGNNNNNNNNCNNNNSNSNNNNNKSRKNKQKKKRDWKEIETQREFMEELYYKQQYTKLSDFQKKLTRKEILQAGGSALLNLYSGNLMTLLQTLFPSYPWKPEERKKPKHYWYSLSNQKSQLEYIVRQLQYQSVIELARLSSAELIQCGGKGLLEYYQGNIPLMLRSIFPRYFNLQNFYRLKMEELFGEFHLQYLGDFKNIRKRKQFLQIIKRKGGEEMIEYYYYNYSKLLQHIYPNYPWLFSKPILLSWHMVESQREYLEYLYLKLCLRSLDDWSYVTNDVLITEGASLLLDFYHGNFNTALSKIYPRYPWYTPPSSPSSPSSSHSNSPPPPPPPRIHCNDNNTSLFSTSSLPRVAESHHRRRVKGDEVEVGRVVSSPSSSSSSSLSTSSSSSSSSSLVGMGVSSSSLFAPTNFYLPFLRLSLPAIKHQFMNDYVLQLQYHFNVQREEDWYRFSEASLQYYNSHYLSHLTAQYNLKKISTIRSTALLLHQLRIKYPDRTWDISKFSQRGRKKSNQCWLKVCLSRLFPIHLLLEDYHHPLLLFDQTDTAVEIDLFLPALSLGLEYQGEQHYDDLNHLNYNEYYKAKDHQKLMICNENVIRLISIPYWWDKSPSTLQSLLYSASNQLN